MYGIKNHHNHPSTSQKTGTNQGVNANSNRVSGHEDMKPPHMKRQRNDGPGSHANQPNSLLKPPPPPPQNLPSSQSKPMEKPRNDQVSTSQGQKSKEVGPPPAKRSRITQDLLGYIDGFKFPYISDISCYEKLAKIGQGTFGEVFKARCKKTGRYVALKKILMENEKEGFPITALREVKMLQKLKHDNITELIEICSSKNTSSRDRCTFFLVFSFCDHDLAGLLSNANVALSLKEVKTLMKHLLNGLYKIHSSNILHRDMKAANVLISRDGVLKLADFGLARPLFKKLPGKIEPCYTNRVVTLWYRPPELLLGARNYDAKIDMWGAGCIMAELWTRSPILQGDTEQKQLTLISNLCGSITPQTWKGCDQLPYYGRLELPQGLQRRVREKLSNYIKDENALSLIDGLLTLNPTDRFDSDKALDHLFFFEDPKPEENVKELISKIPSSLFEFTVGRGAHAGRRLQNVPQSSVQQPRSSQPNVPQQRRHVPSQTSSQFQDRIY